MRTYKTILSIIYLTFITQNINGQSMSDLLQKSLIDNYYRYLQDSYPLATDTMYYISSFSDCSNNWWDYKIDVNNEKIAFRIPNVDQSNPISSVFKLNAPELDGQSISISIGIYTLQYESPNEDIKLIYQGTTAYIYRYNKKKKSYELISRKDLSL